MAADRKRRRRRSSAVVLLNGLLSLIVLAIIVAGVIAWYGISQYYKPGSNDQETAFLVEKGSGFGTIAQRLADQGLIDNVLLFRGAYQLTKSGANIQAGQYVLPAHASMDDILRVITETKPQEFFINVIPGETSWQVAEKLNDPAQALSGAQINPPLEGTLLAVRHDFFPGDSRQSVIDAMQKTMADEMVKIWADHDPAIDDVIKNPGQLVTLASLVEKETGLETERPDVASVFINRLRKHMRLQTDPSVIYGITQGRDKLDRKLTTADLKAKTPYNTYQIDGLPPGPIGNPGVEALKAVAHPSKTSFLYFVAKGPDPQDGHTFASTYAEHRKNVLKYRQAVADDEAEQAKDALEEQQAKDAGDTTTGDSAQ
jgi:UPF0755 protein